MKTVASNTTLIFMKISTCDNQARAADDMHHIILHGNAHGLWTIENK